MRPERWLDGRSLPAEQYAFMKFGQGVRKCPGEQYTRLVMACMLFGLIGRFKFELPDGADVMADGGKVVAFGIVMKAKVLANVEEVPGRGPASGESQNRRGHGL
jgi:cytochrome P450